MDEETKKVKTTRPTGDVLKKIKGIGTATINVITKN